MANKCYDNFVLENKIEDMLITQLDMNAYITPDYSLTEAPGMVKKVNTYTGLGNVEDLAMGEGNTQDIGVDYSTKEYRVGVTQGRFPYYDEQEMTDPMVVETGLKKLAENMTNDLTTKAIAEFGNATILSPITAWSFDDFVDAIAKYPHENEDGLFCLVNPAQKAAIRKQLGDTLQYSEGFARTGYIGTVCGVPVIISKAVPEGIAFLATKDAVKVFVKKGVEVEQERDADHRKNTVFARKVMLVALTDATRVVKMGKEQATAATITTATAGNKTVSGAATTGATVEVYINGVLDGTATAAANAYTYTAKANLATSDVVKVVARVEGFLESIATKTV